MPDLLLSGRGMFSFAGGAVLLPSPLDEVRGSDDAIASWMGSNATSVWIGSTVAVAGDMDGDGIPELLIADPGETKYHGARVFVVSASERGTTTLGDTDLASVELGTYMYIHTAELAGASSTGTATATTTSPSQPRARTIPTPRMQAARVSSTVRSTTLRGSTRPPCRS